MAQVSNIYITATQFEIEFRWLETVFSTFQHVGFDESL